MGSGAIKKLQREVIASLNREVKLCHMIESIVQIIDDEEKLGNKFSKDGQERLLAQIGELEQLSKGKRS